MARLVGLLLLLRAGLGAAQTAAPAEAKELFRQARERYEAADFVQAAALFKRSYELSKAPALLFNLGQAQRRLGECGPALESYRGYLAGLPGAANAPEVKEYIAAMERCLSERGPTRVEPPTVSVPTSTAEPTALDGLARASDPPALAPPSAGLLVTSGALVVLGLGAAIAGGLLYSEATIKAADLTSVLERSTPQQPGNWSLLRQAQDEAWRREAAVAGGLFVGAATALVVAGVLTVIAFLTREPQP